MHGICCDGCGEPLLVDSNVRYVVKVQVYAAYDPLEITEDDLEKVTPEAWNDLMEELNDADADTLESEVHISFQYDLCPACRRTYVKDPLKTVRREER